MSNIERKMNADRILYEFGLLKKIEEIGKAHIIGSYRMNMMAWNDLDIDVYKAVLEGNVKNIDDFFAFLA